MVANEFQFLERNNFPNDMFRVLYVNILLLLLGVSLFLWEEDLVLFSVHRAIVDIVTVF